MKPVLLSAAALGGLAALTAALIGSDRPETPSAPAPLVLSGEGPALAYHAGTIHLPGAQEVHDAYLVVEGGKVVDVVGADRLPPLIQVEDFGDAHLAPGLVAAWSTVTGYQGEHDRSMAAHARAIDSFDPFDDTTKVLERGITSYYLSPSAHRLVGGRGAVVKAAGEDRVLRAEADLLINLTPEAWNPPDYFRPPIPPTAENPLLPAVDQAPNSRPGAMRALRHMMLADDAQDFNVQGYRAWAATDAPLRLRVDRADEVASAFQLPGISQVRVVLDGLDQADPEALSSLLDKHEAMVLFAVPLFANLPNLSTDWQVPDPELLSSLANRSLIALRPGPYARWTWLQEAATSAVAYGLEPERALSAITEVPARALGVGDRVGALRQGLDADFVVWSSDPVDPAASVEKVYIDGKPVWDVSALPQVAMGSAVVVRGGTLWTGDGPPLSGGAEVLLADGKVVAAGKVVPHPAGARVIDAGPEAHLTPGFIDAGSRLGIGNRRLNPRADLRRLADGSLFSDQWQAVARAGVTSMVLAGNPSASGTPAAIVKTADDGSGRYRLDRQVVLLDARSSDDASAAGSLKRTLDQAKAYADKWAKYREARAAWEKEQVSKSANERAEREKALRLRLAQGAAPAKEEVKEEEVEDNAAGEEEAEDKTPVDPLNGLWEGTLEHEMLPEPVDINVRFHHEGKDLTAVLSSPDDPSGETLELEGTFENNIVHIELPTEVGNVMMDGTITGPDTMSVHVELAGFGSVDFQMTRIEVEEAGAAPIAKKRKRKDGGPSAPGVDWRQEGLRALYEHRAVAVVSVSDLAEFEQAQQAFAAAELPWLAQLDQGRLELQEAIEAAGIGVVLGPDVVIRKDNRDLVPAARYHAAGVPVLFRSNATLGARFLPQLLAMATRYGLGAEDAMASLTSEAADALGLGDRLGHLAPGCDGDLVIFSGHPFDLRSRVSRVFVNGQEVPQP